MELGTIIEFEHLDRHHIGAIVGAVGKKKLIVMTADGVEMRPRLGSVTFTFDEPVDASAGREGVSRQLAELESRAAEAASALDLDAIWAASRGLVAPFEVDALDEVLPEGASEMDRVGLRRRVRDDDEYFRMRKHGLEPRTPEELDELRARRARAAERLREERAFVALVVELLDPSLEARSERIGDALDSEPFAHRITILQDFACYAGESRDSREAERLLDHLEDALGHPLRGTGSHRAFWVNVELGLWSEHESVSLRRFRASREPSPEAMEQADALVSLGWTAATAAASESEAPTERRDFGDWWTCTIDDPETRDLDDALSVQPRIDGGWRVAVHIADPSAWIEVGSSLDLHAREMATSVYLPTGAIPMFPRELTERAMSLVEGAERPALTILFEFSPHLETESVTIEQTTVKVDRRLDYTTVDAVLAGARLDDIPSDALRALRYIADEFHMRRMDGGAIDIGLPETKLHVDTGGRIPSAEVLISKDSASRSLVGEFMIAANVAVAEFCEENDIPTIYRLQEPPDGDLDDDDIMSVPDGYAREFARLKRMRRGLISTEPGSHAGLGVRRYVQSSSPIRRYTDLVAQRQIKAHLTGAPLPYDEDELLDIISTYDRAKYEAKEMEGEETDYWMTWLLGRAGGPISAEVIDVRDPSRNLVAVFLTDYGYRANCVLKELVPLGEFVELDVTRADPRHGALSLREA